MSRNILRLFYTEKQGLAIPLGKEGGSVAVNLLKGLIDKLVYVNTQVLHEFYSVMIRTGQATMRSGTSSTRSSGKQRSP